MVPIFTIQIIALKDEVLQHSSKMQTLSTGKASSAKISEVILEGYLLIIMVTAKKYTVTPKRTVAQSLINVYRFR